MFEVQKLQVWFICQMLPGRRPINLGYFIQDKDFSLRLGESLTNF